MVNIADRQKFLAGFIESAFRELSMEKLFEIYQKFQVINGEEFDEYDTDLLRNVALFARVRKENDMIKEAAEPLAYLIQHDCQEDLYPLITETLIRTLQLTYPGDFSIARRFL